jgi:predicted nucleic acid-binding protein
MPNASATIAVLDANVLYRAPLRDFLLCLAEAEIFVPRWSEKIHEEWTRNLLANRDDLAPERVKRTCSLMDKAFPEASVFGYEHLIPSLTNDEKDRHVLAAAVVGGASYIVTFNRKDFPRESLSPHHITVISPDSFLMMLYKKHEAEIVAVAKDHLAQLQKPAKTADQYLETLRQNRLTRIAELLREHLVGARDQYCSYLSCKLRGVLVPFSPKKQGKVQSVIINL